MKLYDPGTLKPFLGRHGISPSKGLGQHFLCSRDVVFSIVREFASCQGVCEIGPGPGVLTGPVSELAVKMIALELDDRMISALAESAPLAEARKADALKVDLLSILRELPEPRGIVSNLPYYITGPLLGKIADARSEIAVAVLMMQKEVAARLLAQPGNADRGAMSVFFQAQFEISHVIDAPARVFLPPPKVDSTVLRFIPRPDSVSAAIFELVRLGFAQPRKTLANNLVAGLHRPREEMAVAIGAVGLGEKARPHDVTLEQWILLHESCRTTPSS